MLEHEFMCSLPGGAIAHVPLRARLSPNWIAD
jgi:hypothetical protein